MKSTVPNPTLQAVVSASTLPSVLPEQQLASLGLTLQDQSEIESIAKSLDDNGYQTIINFGREVAQHSVGYADSMLEQVRASDLDAMGGKLTEIVSNAQSLNFQALGEKRSKIPWIGGLIDRVRQSKDELINSFSSVKTNIDRLVNEVGDMQTGLVARNAALDAGFTTVKEEYRKLGLHIAAGHTVHQWLLQEIEQIKGKASAGKLTEFETQDLQDRIGAASILEKRITDLRVLQHSALQTLPMIRMVQTNNAMLVEKFHTIKDLTLPAWKRQFMLALSLNEQRSAVQLAHSIDDATNAFLVENAQILKQNTIETARSNQRMVVDVETLQQVQDTLLSTVSEVIQINQDGMGQRAKVADQLSAMREQMRTQLGQSGQPTDLLRNDRG